MIFMKGHKLAGSGHITSIDIGALLLVCWCNALLPGLNSMHKKFAISLKLLSYKAFSFLFTYTPK
jgi:hypothetical protein